MKIIFVIFIKSNIVFCVVLSLDRTFHLRLLTTTVNQSAPIIYILLSLESYFFYVEFENGSPNDRFDNNYFLNPINFTVLTFLLTIRNCAFCWSSSNILVEWSKKYIGNCIFFLFFFDDRLHNFGLKECMLITCNLNCFDIKIIKICFFDFD